MWSNINLGGFVESALEKANTIKESIESQMDGAVGNDPKNETKNPEDLRTDDDSGKDGPQDSPPPLPDDQPPSAAVVSSTNVEEGIALHSIPLRSSVHRHDSISSASSHRSSRSPPPPLNRKNFETTTDDPHREEQPRSRMFSNSADESDDEDMFMKGEPESQTEPGSSTSEQHVHFTSEDPMQKEGKHDVDDNCISPAASISAPSSTKEGKHEVGDNSVSPAASISAPSSKEYQGGLPSMGISEQDSQYKKGEEVHLSSRPQIIMNKPPAAAHPPTPGVYRVPPTRTPRENHQVYFPPEDPSKFPIVPTTPRTDDMLWAESQEEEKAINPEEADPAELAEDTAYDAPREYVQIFADKQNAIQNENEPISYTISSSNVNTYHHDHSEQKSTESTPFPLTLTSPRFDTEDGLWGVFRESKSMDEEFNVKKKSDTKVTEADDGNEEKVESGANPKAASAPGDEVATAQFVESLRQKELAFERERADLEARLSEATAALQNSESDRKHLQETLEQRERQLESTSHQLAALNENLAAALQMQEDSDSEIQRLKTALQDEIKARASLGKEANRVAELQQELRENEGKMTGLLEEGKKLSMRQGEVEQSLRKARAELKTSEADKQRVIKEKVGLQERIEELVQQLKTQNDEKANQSQSIAAMHAVSQASSDKLAKVEAEKNAALQEIADKTKALDKAWAQMNDVKKELAELKAERDNLASRLKDQQLSEEVSKKDRREWLDREQRLQASLEQLEASLARHQTEADHREKGLQREAESLRQRWLDAVARSEAIASGVQEAGAPLLRQIKGLQEEARARATAWAATEASLSERTATAEAAARAAEIAKASAEARFTQASKDLSDSVAELEELKNEVIGLKSDLKKAESKAEKAQERLVELEGELTGTKEVYSRAIKEAKGTEAKLKLQVTTYRDQMESIKGELEESLASSQNTVSKLQSELERERTRQKLVTRTNSQGPVTQGGFLAQSLEGEENSGSSQSQPTTNPADAAAGNTSLAAVQQLQRSLRQKEGEAAHLHEQLRTMEHTRGALAEEVNHLSKDNSKLQRQNKELQLLKRRHTELESKYEVLLDLLGEKSEELDALQQDMESLKASYKAQLEQLVPKDS